MAISMLKIRRPLGRLIFNMGIAIPGKTVFLIETAPRLFRFDIKISANFPVMDLLCRESHKTGRFICTKETSTITKVLIRFHHQGSRNDIYLSQQT